MSLDNTDVRIVVINSKKLLCGSSKWFLYAKGPKLYGMNRLSGKEFYIGSLPVAIKYRFLQNIRLMQRLFRLEPRCAIFVDEENAIVSFHGTVYRVNLLKKEIYCEHVFRKGMNNPLSFCEIKRLPSFEDGICYGDYFGNLSRENVCIYFRGKDGKWKQTFSFEPGQVQHIHRIFSHTNRDSIIVFTGDSDEESAIWEITDGFKKCKKITGGKQIYRSCVGFPYNDGIVYATDTPLETNAIYNLKLDQSSAALEKITDIHGPVTNGIIDTHGNMYFATSVEPDPKIKPYWKYMISYKLGEGVKDCCCHVYAGNPQIGFKELLQVPKDRWPMLLMQFGTFQFAPLREQKCIYMSGRSLIDYDGNTVLVKDNMA